MKFPSWQAAGLYLGLGLAPLVLTTAFVAQPAQAAAEQAVPVALDGYDPVAYFMHGEAMKGDKGMKAMVRGKVYYFAMAEHAQAFTANPDQYLPQFDGLCAACLTQGQRVPGNPAFFVIEDGRLYFNADEHSQAAFTKDPAGMLSVAQRIFRARRGRA